MTSGNSVLNKFLSNSNLLISLCPNWLIPDQTGIESVFIDFKVLYIRITRETSIISQKIKGFGGRPAPPPKSGPASCNSIDTYKVGQEVTLLVFAFSLVRCIIFAIFVYSRISIMTSFFVNNVNTL